MNSLREPDHLLVSRVQDGDRCAFDQLAARYRSRLLRLILRIVHDSADAEDVLQDTLVRAYRAIHSFRGDSAFYTWLFRIAVNTATAFVTGRRHRIEACTDSADPSSAAIAELETDSITPEDILLGKQMAEIVGRAVASLAPEHCAAITMHEVDGLSYQEIADAMLCPIGTVRSRIANARLVIASRLEPLSRLH
ncbi:sigma-70 family RNA polymerase sigma factor [Massilia sp. GCM10020059]|uniref:RNA polymerase sigma factor n=1 Tax=Massilia agrisoli TaxID=2892444 RepID=A0ABS8INT6_9BURK|nr:sigma-70 family RNA polymerase sigma factor [Massilia agrisoli]MCC6070005.1 sigma-70 family RNA polymerase sigma factor [Massilia agrisoli]